jgi:hypothetical protein
MILTLDERLNQIIPRITSPDFLGSKGLGNEIGFWIFDYSPDREMDVRDFLERHRTSCTPQAGTERPCGSRQFIDAGFRPPARAKSP